MATEKRLIDANALQFKPEPIDNVMNGVLFIRGRGVGKTVAMVSEALKHMIDNAPTVDAVEVVRGRWILEQDYGDGTADYKCSNCEYDDNFFTKTLEIYIKHCPHCGARMDGDGNDTATDKT